MPTPPKPTRMRLFGPGRRPGPSRPLRGILLFARAQDGAAALEFALVSIPFLAILIAILETALVFFAQQVLQTATTDASRLIMTGQAQTANMTAAQFKAALCANASALFDCTQLHVNVQKFSSFTSMSQGIPLSGGNFVNNQTYNTGVAGDIVLVQAFYQWPVFLAPLGFDLSNMNGNIRLLTGTAVFRNEPY